VRPDDDSKPVPTIDLHRRTAAEAVRILERELHSARVRGFPAVIVITGRGYGNAEHEPILRGKVERWLATPAARSRGVRSFRRVHKEGALEVRLAVAGEHGRHRGGPNGRSGADEEGDPDRGGIDGVRER
jgi:DNA-nicking Smr family endonuclease